MSRSSLRTLHRWYCHFCGERHRQEAWLGDIQPSFYESGEVFGIGWFVHLFGRARF